MAVKIIKGGVAYSPGSTVPNEHKQRVLDAIGKPEAKLTISLADLAAKAGLTTKETRAALKVVKRRDVTVLLPEEEILKRKPSPEQAAALAAALAKARPTEIQRHDSPLENDTTYDKEL